VGARSELEWLGLELALGRYFIGKGEGKGMLLARMCRSAGRPLTPERLTLNSNLSVEAVKVYICFLRQSLDELGFEVTIETVRGIGYRISPEDAEKVIARVNQSLDYLRDAA
jgi:DNA-binding winged helix-turn-helix (wHTH) protein